MDERAIDVLHDAWNWGDRRAFEDALNRGQVPGSADLDCYGRTGLWLSASIGSTLGVTLFLERGADVDFLGRRGALSPLHASVFWNHPEVVELLLRWGATPDVRDLHAQTPLMRASLDGRLPMVESLLTWGSHVDLADMNGGTALMMAVGRRRVEIARRLLAAGAHPDVRDEKGQTALMRAGNIASIQLLIEHGADVSLKDHAGRTVRDVMRERRRIHVLRFLDEHERRRGS